MGEIRNPNRMASERRSGRGQMELFRLVQSESNAKWLQFIAPMMAKRWRVKNGEGFLLNPCAGRATLLRSRHQGGAPTFLSASPCKPEPRRQECRRSGLDADPRERRPTGAGLRGGLSIFHLTFLPTIRFWQGLFRVSGFGFRISDFAFRAP